MTAKEALCKLREAEVIYLRARGWRPWDVNGVLWVDPLESTKTHIARAAAYKQRQRDANAEDMQ